MDIIIRPYEARDRSAVRQICCDTADRGNPVESILPERDMVADLMSRYYTDYEPQATWVAECDGQVIGYLNGTVQTCRFFWLNYWWVAPMVLLRAAGQAGVHVAIREDNPRAMQLFERLGFTELSRHPFILPNGSSWHVTSMVMYAKRV